MEDAEEGYQEAEAALEIMEEAEAEEAELEEVEDLLEYYLQRATTTQSEAERLLAGSRDLEESIGVSLSARRFEVDPLLCMSLVMLGSCVITKAVHHSLGLSRFELSWVICYDARDVPVLDYPCHALLQEKTCRSATATTSLEFWFGSALTLVAWNVSL